MPINIDIKILPTGRDPLQTRAGRAAFRSGVLRGVTRTIERGATYARRNVRRDTGNLAASIQTRVGPGAGATLVEGAVFTNTSAPYAPYVEFGTRPHFVPIRPLKDWARRVLGDEQAAYAIRVHISRYGTVGAGPGRIGPQPTGVFTEMLARMGRDLPREVTREVARAVQQYEKGQARLFPVISAE